MSGEGISLLILQTNAPTGAEGWEAQLGQAVLEMEPPLQLRGNAKEMVNKRTGILWIT